MPITDTLLSKNLTKKLTKLDRKIDLIGPTPLRQTLDACAVFSINLLRLFDQERFERDEAYANKMYELNKNFHTVINNLEAGFRNANNV